VRRSLGPTAEDNEVKVERNPDFDSEKLVVVLGWGGARQKHLSRIRQFYSSSGYVVISYISPMSCFLRGHLDERNILGLASAIGTEVASFKRQVFHIHLHSNNGIMVLAGLMLVLKEATPEVYECLHGIVLDSAPRVPETPPSLVMTALGVTFPAVPIILQRNTYIHPVWTPALFVFFLVRFLWMRLTNSAHLSHRFSLAPLRKVLLAGLPLVPQLYIYSMADKLITAPNVEAFMARQRRLGAEVSAKKFDNTPHVQHFLRREHEYKEALTAFLDQRR